MANTPVILSPTAAAEIAAGLRELRSPKRPQRRRSWPWVLFPPDWPGIGVSAWPLVLPAGPMPDVLWFPEAGTITRVSCFCDQPDTFGLTFYLGAYSAYPTGSAIGSEAFVASRKVQDSALTGWTISIPALSFLTCTITGTPALATWVRAWLEVS